ncbi:enoyl-CoA hydratase [Alicyclobacillus ferrooxydans]|uniref:Enoyl-CoA hydratase n=1 Tax=Alicyclobacillus ferrooxydans TaxID=471514 RepID=A0A0P9CI96_9BACL|nr:enoyl-CoA hydratase [Alicyclobacillus ferrooxydans]KPV45404.1 enoyl-CoA hydratase [Alicyclobacillus ferrooxydans]
MAQLIGIAKEETAVSSSLVLFEETGGIATITLNRPESANALSRELLTELSGILTEVAHREDVRVVVVTGAGDRAFCAGADLKERKGMNDAEVKAAVQGIRSSIHAVSALPQPVIAAVNGVAFGGGTELALAADIRLASETAKFGLTETSLAIIPGAGGTQRLPRLIGMAKAKELIFTARRIDAKEAMRLGLVNETVASEELLSRAREIAEEIASNGPIAVRQAKLAINKGAEVDLETGLAIEGLAYQAVIPTEDRIEGLTAFAEKRKPQYKGK